MDIVLRILAFIESPAGQQLIAALAKLVESNPTLAADLIARFAPPKPPAA